jgi:hypothetical protein
MAYTRLPIDDSTTRALRQWGGAGLHVLSALSSRSSGRALLPSVGIVSSLLLTPTFGFDEGFDRYYALVEEAAERLVDTAIREMEESGGRGRFLFLRLFDAHWPYFPPEELMSRFGERPKDMSELLKKVLSEDRGEKNDIIAQRGRRNVEALRSEVRSFLKDVRGRRAGGSSGAIALDEEMREKLRALGYLDP